MQDHVVKFVTKPGCRDGLVDLLSGMFPQAEKEPGTLLYLMHQSPQNPDEIWFFEVFSDAEAFAIHLASEPHDHLAANYEQFLAEPLKLISLRLVGGKGL